MFRGLASRTSLRLFFVGKPKLRQCLRLPVLLDEREEFFQSGASRQDLIEARLAVYTHGRLARTASQTSTTHRHDFYAAARTVRTAISSSDLHTCFSARSEASPAVMHNQPWQLSCHAITMPCHARYTPHPTRDLIIISEKVAARLNEIEDVNTSHSLKC